jgi:hypothetical protein
VRWTIVAGGVIAASTSSCAPEPAAPPPPAPEPTPRVEARDARGDSLVDPLWEVDLSDEAVARLSLDDLWRIGSVYCGWAEAPPEGIDKEEVHQRLMSEKYRDIADDIGYDER